MLMCPNCGAAAAATDVQCGYCNTQLQTISCASCLGMIFRGAKHCSHCGARTFSAAVGDAGSADAPDARADAPHRCPRCHDALAVSAVGSAFLEECRACG